MAVYKHELIPPQLPEGVEVKHLGHPVKVAWQLIHFGGLYHEVVSEGSNVHVDEWALYRVKTIVSEPQGVEPGAGFEPAKKRICSPPH